MKTAECRSCKAAIVWLKTDRGKNMPVDADTVQDDGATVFDPDQGMVSHFATCASAAEHRRPKK